MMGAPGSGKGTQGELLEKKTGFKRYIMSDLIKKVVKKGDEIYDKMLSGLLLSDLDIFEIFRKGFDLEDKVIIDGIPRSLDQAYWLYGFLKNHGYEIEVVYLSVDEKKLLERILKRGRKDDNSDIFKHRLEQYDKARDVVLRVYSKEVVKVNADRDVNIIFEDICNKLKLN